MLVEQLPVGLCATGADNQHRRSIQLPGFHFCFLLSAFGFFFQLRHQVPAESACWIEEEHQDGLTSELRQSVSFACHVRQFKERRVRTDGQARRLGRFAEFQLTEPLFQIFKPKQHSPALTEQLPAETGDHEDREKCEHHSEYCEGAHSSLSIFVIGY